MKVLIDAWWLISGPPSGRMVVRQFIAAWSSEHAEDDLVLAVPRSEQGRARDLFSALDVIGLRAPLHPLAASLSMPALARRIGADLLITQNFAPFSRTVPSAVFVHDVLFQTNPSWFTRSERAYLSLIPMLLPRASRVLTSSKTEAQRIRDENGRAPQIIATGLGISDGLRHDAPARPVDGLAPGSFLLAVGRLNVRKNLTTTIEAAVESGALSAAFPLVVVGERSGLGEHLSATASRAEAQGLVRYVGAVDDDELRWLYEHCRLLLFLSRDEGWGLPPVEAANLGSQVLVSDRPVFHETLGSDAIFVDPDDVTAVTRTLRGMLEAPYIPAEPSDTHRQRAGWRSLVAAARATPED